MAQTIGYVSLVVRDYDEAIAFFTGVLNFTLVEDSVATDSDGNRKRWVLVRPPGSRGADLLLARASSSAQESRIGNQTGGRVFLFLHTDDFSRDYREMTARGVKFVRPPREDSYGTVAVFEDLYGNLWDLLELKRTALKVESAQPPSERPEARG
jgi:catechol 2,3-dioxygenase-like lactoylglutathione lyase family enzyme